MSSLDDPEFVEALQKMFATKGDIRAIADYQQKLYQSLSELNSSHRAVHDHVRRLSESHTRGEGNTELLLRAREDLERLLRNLEQAHGQTQNEMRRAAQELNQVQQEIHKVRLLEDRLERLEREFDKLVREEREDNRKDDEHDRRLDRLERR